MRVLRIEHKHNSKRGVYAGIASYISAFHPSGFGWEHLPNIHGDTNYKATSAHVCACRTLQEFGEWWPDVLLRALHSDLELRVVVLSVQRYRLACWYTVLHGQYQAGVDRDACTEVCSFTVKQYLSLGMQARADLFNDQGDNYVDEQRRQSRDARDEPEEPRGHSQRFAREARRAASKMWEPVQVGDACDFQGALYRFVDADLQDFIQEAV